VNISKIEQYIIDFVRELRVSKKLTQDDIANILHVSRSFIKGIESSNQAHKYNLNHINALSDHFNMSPADFMPTKPFPVNPASKEKGKSKSAAISKKVIVKKSASAVKKK